MSGQRMGEDCGISFYDSEQDGRYHGQEEKDFHRKDDAHSQLCRKQ